MKPEAIRKNVAPKGGRALSLPAWAVYDDAKLGGVLLVYENGACIVTDKDAPLESYAVAGRVPREGKPLGAWGLDVVAGILPKVAKSKRPETVDVVLVPRNDAPEGAKLPSVLMVLAGDESGAVAASRTDARIPDSLDDDELEPREVVTALAAE